MQFQILCRSFPIFSSLIRRKGDNREIWWLAVTSHVCNFTIHAIPLVSNSMRTNMMRAIWKQILELVKSRKVFLTHENNPDGSKYERERAASGWAGLSCDARQQLGERMRTSALSACAPSSQGREIQRTHCACSAARIWLTHTRVPLCTPYMNATFIECLNFH